jgi:hypothetical protein
VHVVCTGQAVSARMGPLLRTVTPTGTAISAHPGDN